MTETKSKTVQLWKNPNLLEAQGTRLSEREPPKARVESTITFEFPARNPVGCQIASNEKVGKTVCALRSTAQPIALP